MNADAGSVAVSWLLSPCVGLGGKLSSDSWVTAALCRLPQFRVIPGKPVDLRKEWPTFTLAVG